MNEFRTPGRVTMDIPRMTSCLWCDSTVHAGTGSHGSKKQEWKRCCGITWLTMWNTWIHFTDCLEKVGRLQQRKGNRGWNKAITAPCNKNKKVKQKIESYCHRSAVPTQLHTHHRQCKQHKSHLRRSMWFFILQPWPQVTTNATFQHGNRTKEIINQDTLQIPCGKHQSGRSQESREI